MEAIKRDFGSFQKMKEKMSAATVAVQGSGWGWLGYDKENGRLRIAACANQDPLQGTTGQFKMALEVKMESDPPILVSYSFLHYTLFFFLSLRSHPPSWH